MFFESSVDAAGLLTKKLLKEASVPHWRQMIKSGNLNNKLELLVRVRARSLNKKEEPFVNE